MCALQQWYSFNGPAKEEVLIVLHSVRGFVCIELANNKDFKKDRPSCLFIWGMMRRSAHAREINGWQADLSSGHNKFQRERINQSKG
ncbi:hypothetical protein [Cyanobium sp. ATX 6F1]|uniref:hypothetical protein n=1 Tax=Cyanobium sp. ATX 6F1 TaxID=2823702 RepID=UPI0020CDBA0D|nr:hypothetical protein [Cyanobium sp. ATX 6F1]MCP9915641.1 hypothetical protein [Cyanobium sp. ATX 6F1]